MDKKLLTHVAAALFVMAVIIYGLQILLFKQPETTAFYIFQDMAFMPVTIAVATLLVGYLMDESDKAERIERSRILTSSFYSIVGYDLFEILTELYDEKKEVVSWDLDQYTAMLNMINTYLNEILTIASNPNLLEHEAFTDVLWAVMHFREEMTYYLAEKPSAKDNRHVQVDAKRVYDLLSENVKEYEHYISVEYPYFYRQIKENSKN